MANVFEMDLICNNNGYITKSDADGLDLEEIQNLIDAIEEAVKQDVANLKVLKKVRSEKGLKMFEEEYPGMTSFETDTHIFIKQPKTKASTVKLAEKHPAIWRDLCKTHPEFLDLSKEDAMTYLEMKHATDEQKESIMNEIVVDMTPAVTVRKRTVTL